MNEYIVQEVARQQLNDRIAGARRAKAARRVSVGRGHRARRGGPGLAASGHVATVARTASAAAQAGHAIAGNVRHPFGAFRSWLAAGQL